MYYTNVFDCPLSLSFPTPSLSFPPVCLFVCCLIYFPSKQICVIVVVEERLLRGPNEWSFSAATLSFYCYSLSCVYEFLLNVLSFSPLFFFASNKSLSACLWFCVTCACLSVCLSVSLSLPLRCSEGKKVPSLDALFLSLS